MNDIDAVLDAVLNAQEDGEGPVLSVYVGTAAQDEDQDSLTHRLCRDADVPHKQVRRTTVQDLLDAGFKLEHSVSEGEPDCHFHVVFPENLSSLEIEKFIECFEPPVPNPTGGNRRPR